ncbi:MAG: AAC(3) family N-acetyltransferase [Candidatus Firestonebacteria bacterium]
MKKLDLISALKNNGIIRGSKLLLHSSYKSIDFEGAPEEVCKSFMEAVGEEGLLVMPTHSLNFKNFPKNNGPYNPGRSPSRVGAITDAFWKLPRVARSLHPSHSDAAWGRGAKELVSGHEKVDAMGTNSPLERFSRTDGKILMMGCKLSSCTMGHVAEWQAKVPYLAEHYDPTWGYEAEYIDEVDGKVKIYSYKTVPGCSFGFENAVPWLKETGFLKEISLNKEVSYLIDAAGFMKVVTEKLIQNPAALLINDEAHIAKCHHCRYVQKLTQAP